jgi:hypothetical protein
VTRQPPDLDHEAILAAAVQRLEKLRMREAAVALAESRITSIRTFNEWTTAEVYISSPVDSYDALTDDGLYQHDVEFDDFGNEYPVFGTSRLSKVFSQVLPERMTCRDVEVKIGPVSPDWLEEFRKAQALNELASVLARNDHRVSVAAVDEPVAGPGDPLELPSTVSAGVQPGADNERESDRLGYPTLQEIESKRRELAEAGRPHGYDALGGKSTSAPFPGQRSTIRRRYQDAGLPPPGSWIPGVCDKAPRHPHPAST